MHSLNVLRQYKLLVVEAQELGERVKELELTMICPKVPKMSASGGSGSGSGSSDKVGEIVVRMEELRGRYYKKLGELVKTVEQVDDMLEGLPEQERLVLRLRYCRGWKWSQIADKLGVEVMTAHRIHKRALENLK